MKTEHDELDPLEPDRAQELCLKQKEMNASKKTVQSHKYRLNAFVRWCDENDIDNLNELTGRDLQEYRLWRQDDADLKKIALTQQMSTIRVFIKWCGSMEAVPADLYEKL
jgi:site-specific recombinase XerD